MYNSVTYICISQCSRCVFHVVGFEVYACARAKTDILMTCSLGGTATGLLLTYFILTTFIDVFPKTIARSFDGLLTLLRKCLCIRWLKIILISIQRLQTACNDLLDYLQKSPNFPGKYDSIADECSV